jgi:hypothetical protein
VTRGRREEDDDETCVVFVDKGDDSARRTFVRAAFTGRAAMPPWLAAPQTELLPRTRRMRERARLDTKKVF